MDTHKKKSVNFLHSNGKHTEEDFRATNIFTICLNKIKYVRISPSKEVKEFYNGNFKTLREKLKKMLEERKCSRAYSLHESMLWMCL